MRKALIGAPALIAIALSLCFSAGAAAKAKTTVHIRTTLIGAQVSPGENVYDVQGRNRGAAIQFPKANAAGTGGTYTSTAYFSGGTVVSVGRYTNTAPDANGIVTIHATGRWVRGTGLYKHISGKFTGSGTLNTKNGHLKIVLVGTQTY